jgi:hypothetical protein
MLLRDVCCPEWKRESNALENKFRNTKEVIGVHPFLLSKT